MTMNFSQHIKAVTEVFSCTSSVVINFNSIEAFDTHYTDIITRLIGKSPIVELSSDDNNISNSESNGFLFKTIKPMHGDFDPYWSLIITDITENYRLKKLLFYILSLGDDVQIETMTITKFEIININ